MSFGLITVWNSSRFESVIPYVIPKSLQQHVTHYCNFPVRTSGVEGSLSWQELLNKKRFHLEMIQVVIRHGDRSQAIFIPNIDSRRYDFDCSFHTSDDNHKQLFEDFRQATGYYTLRKFINGEKVTQSLLPSGRKCEMGQLSQRGFLQHFDLGSHMRTVYSGLINDELSLGNLHVRSTDRSRCIQSGAAFLFGLLTKDKVMNGKTLPWLV